MSSATEITPNTEESKALQNDIQKDLITRGYSTEGDEVMAEFVLVMLCNQKTPDQITNELNDLIGSDFDPSFTTWLFQTVARHYPKSRQAEHAAPLAPAESPAEFNHTQQSQQQATARGQRKPGTNAFGIAWNQPPTGQKRQHDFGGRDDRAQRPRVDGPPVHAPTGPKNPQPTDGMASAGPPRRLFDRLGPGPSPSGNALPVMSPMGPALYNPQTGEFAPVPGPGGPQRHDGRGGNRRHQQGPPGPPQPMMFPGGGVPFFIPPGMMPQFPQGGMFPPQMFAQFQQQMQQQGGGPGGPTPGFVPLPPPGASQAPATTQTVPTKPLDDSLCKYATECKNAYCKFAHPSPAATSESGLVLSSEPCDKQLDCTDMDCPRSHISPQAKDPANSRTPAANDNASVPRPSAPPASAFGQTPSGKPCKFGGACTRPDCVFAHPWDKSGTPCRFGASCTRGDCHFSHPPGHRPYKASRGGYQHFGPPKGNRTAVFNTGTPVSEKLRETEAEKAALSDRMKKFGAEDGETERIIPGQAQEENTKPAVENGDAAAKTEE